MNYKKQLKLEKVLRAELFDVLDVIFNLAEEMTFAELAEASGLCDQTVRRLWDGDWVYPRFLTVQKLGYAVGLHIVATKEGMKLSVSPETVTELQAA